MQRAIVAACLSAAFAVALTAQAPAQQPPASGAGTSGSTAGAQESQSSQRGMRPMTMTGCLKAGDTAGTYELTNVEMTGRRGGATSTTGETGGSATSTTGEQGRMGGMRTVMLNAGSDVNLAPHVGHKIEVTGTMGGGRRGSGASSSTTTGSSTATTGAAAEGQGAGSGMGAGRGTRTVNVTSVKMISETCQ
jgi:hypothetical protein